MLMLARAAMLATMVAAAPAGAAGMSGGSMGVGLTVSSSAGCGTAFCLQIVEGRYHPATIAGAAPAPADREVCVASFDRLVADMSNGRPIGRQILYKARRCRSLGLAPVIVSR